ncbi:condensin-2 complex subunit G2 isoform X2 [Erythrolamprus reginae]|uniref:condensin-2 complex subunit G2 isoform X2 n=1 Tax=Erythrolamprus reginae TaxID=121349 RepID=UPI00396CECBF
MSRRESFLNSVNKDSFEDFLHFIKRHDEEFDCFDLYEVLEELSRKQTKTLWNTLKGLVIKVLLDNPIEEWQRKNDDSMETEKNGIQKQTKDMIQAVVTVVTASIPTIEENTDIKDLLECAVLLNNILFVLPDSEKSLSEKILYLAKSWWKKGLERKELFGKTAFLMLLKKRLEKKNVEATIISLYHIRGVLPYFDYDSEESNEIKDLLLGCFMSKAYFETEQGRRFLHVPFTWNVNFTKLIHQTIKNQLLVFPRSLMNRVAEVYVRAWQNNSGEMLEVIECSCIQDFMHHAVHLPRKSPVNPKVRDIMTYFHRQYESHRGFKEVVYRLYRPILWRALKAPNSEIRSNAALLFGDAFPILDPSFHEEEKEIEIQKQFDVLYALLEDPEPRVRSTGILAVSKVTFKYWDMIPTDVVADLLRILIEELAFDTSSDDVRCSVFTCLPIILDNVSSHPLLEYLLPSVKYSLHDNSEKVRVVFVDMLLKIKAVKAAKFWEICPVDHLLARLAIDSRPVSRRLVHLLFDSFWPISQPEKWCERCVALIQMNASAARVFYHYADEYASSNNIAKLMLTIRNCLNSCIQQKLKESEGGDEHSEKENMSVADDVLSVDDIPSMAGLLETIVILWRNILKPLDHDEEAKNLMVQKFASVIPEYLEIFKDDRCVCPIMMLVSFIPPTAIPTFSCGVFSKLKSMKHGVTEKTYSPLLDCLCRWDKSEHILELIADWITSEPRNRETDKTERRVQIQETDVPKRELALDYLECLLTRCVNRNCLLSLSRDKLNRFLKVLECGKDALDSYIQGCDPAYHNFYQATAVRVFSLYCRFNIHLLHKTYLQVCKDLIAIGLGDFEFQASLLNLASQIIYRRKGWVLIPTLLSLLREIGEALLGCDVDKIDCTTELQVNIGKMFQKILETMALKLRREQEEGIQLIHSTREPLGHCVHILQSCVLIFPAIYQGVISSLLAAVMVEMNYSLKEKVSHTENPEELVAPMTFSDLPPLSSTLLATVVKSKQVTGSFLNELLEYNKSEEGEGIISLTTSVYIVELIKGKQDKSNVNTIAATLQELITVYSKTTQEGTERLLCEAALDIVNKMLIV